MNKPLYNILILTAVALVGLTGVSTTNAFYGDTETSQDNSFRASSLELGLTLNSSGADNRDTTASSDGSRDLEYQLFKDTANGDFCSDLQVTISRDGSEIYNGSLAGFTQSGSFPLDSGDFDDFNFNFSVLDDEAQYDGQCTIAFTYNANQPGYAYGEAYNDSKTDMFTLLGENFGTPPDAVEPIVLNEVLPNPEGSDDQGGVQGEWVEIYNNSATPVDLTGWYIKDEANNTQTISSATTWNGQTTIGAPGSGTEWLVLFMSGSILNNTGDTVTLYDASGAVRDSYSYGNQSNDSDSDSNHTGGGDNENPTGGETTSNEGKSDARIPDGTGDWVDPIPTPGAPNVVDSDNTTDETESDPATQMMNTQEDDEAEPAKDNEEEEAKQEDDEEKDDKGDGKKDEEDGDDEENKNGEQDDQATEDGEKEKVEEKENGDSADKQDVEEEDSQGEQDESPESEKENEEESEKTEADNEKDGDGKVEEKTTKENAKDSEGEESETDVKISDEEEESTEDLKGDTGDSVDDSNDDNTDNSGDSGGEDGSDDNSEGTE